MKKDELTAALKRYRLPSILRGSATQHKADKGDVPYGEPTRLVPKTHSGLSVGFQACQPLIYADKPSLMATRANARLFNAAELHELRKKIDNIDEGILDLLALRSGLAKQIAKIKKKKAAKIIDLKREQEVMNSVGKKSEELKLDKKYALGIFKLILKNSRRIQK